MVVATGLAIAPADGKTRGGTLTMESSSGATATGKAQRYSKAGGRLIRGTAGTGRAAGSTTSGGEPPILPLGMEASATNSIDKTWYST